MKNSTRTNTQPGNIQIDPNRISRAVEQFSCVPIRQSSFGVRKGATYPNLDSKCLRKHIPHSYAASRIVKGSLDTDMDASSLFVDARKQQSFDWVKNTNAYQRIIHLSDLEDKWDGYNAPKFSEEQIERTLTIYSRLRTYSIQRGLNFTKIEPFVAPGSDGTILFEWAGKRFSVRQLEVYVPKDADVLFEYLKTSCDSEEEGEFDLDGLYPILDWLFKFDC